MSEPAPRFFRPLAREPVGPHSPLKSDKPVFVHLDEQPLLDALAHVERLLAATPEGLLPKYDRALRSIRSPSRLMDAKKGTALVELGSRLPEGERRAFWREVLVHLITPSGKKSPGPFRRLLNGGTKDEAAIQGFLHRRKGSEINYYFHGSHIAPGAFEMFIKRYRNDLLGRGIGSPTQREETMAALEKQDPVKREIHEEAQALLDAVAALKTEMPEEKPEPKKPAGKPGAKTPLSVKYRKPDPLENPDRWKF
jgi:hypothetical protein